jgi:uncharacterized protein YjiS (DUF1127 family)
MSGLVQLRNYRPFDSTDNSISGSTLTPTGGGYGWDRKPQCRESDADRPMEIAMSSLAQCPKTMSSPGPQRVFASGWLARGMDMLGQLWDFLERAAAGRRALRQLANADDRMLKDIGLDRSDLRNAAAAPRFRDPTELLAGRADEGRTHQPHRLRTRPAARPDRPSRYY